MRRGPKLRIPGQIKFLSCRRFYKRRPVGRRDCVKTQIDGASHSEAATVDWIAVELQRVLPNIMGMASRLSVCSLLCWLLVAVAPHTFAQTYQGKELVRPQLLSDTNAIVPGKSFTVGLLLRMAPGWHTYWQFSGDAGLPTELKWKLPPGWKIDDIQWPIPLKTVDPGDIETYGYENEVLLMQEITPPLKLDGSSDRKST